MGMLDFPNIDGREAAEELPEGLYKVKIKKWEKVKGSQAEQIRFYANVVDVHIDQAKLAEWCQKRGSEATVDTLKGKSIVDHVSLSDKAAWRLVWFLHECLQVNTKDLPKMSTSSEIFDRLLNSCQGRQMWWDVNVNSYEGRDGVVRTNNKVHTYMPVESEGPAEISLEGEVPDWVGQK